VGWDFAPDPTEGAYSAPPDCKLGLRGPSSKGTEGRSGRGVDVKNVPKIFLKI